MLTPAMERIRLTNEKERGEGNIIVKDVLTSSPDVQIYLEDDLAFPLKIKPKRTVDILVGINAEQVGRFDALIYILFEESVVVTSLKAVAHPNKFGIEPIYYPGVLDQEEIVHSLQIANPYTSRQLRLETFYLTNSRFRADFKRSQQSNQGAQGQQRKNGGGANNSG